MEANKEKKKKIVRPENQVSGLADDEDSENEAKKRKKLPDEIFKEKDKDKLNNPEEDQNDKKTVLLELFTKSGIAKVQVLF